MTHFMTGTTTMNTVYLEALPYTSVSFDRPVAYALAPAASATLPVFEAPAGTQITEAVAVALRSEAGLPIDGGLFGVSPDGEVIKLVLRDRERGIDTDSDPAWTAFGMVMSIGKLLVRAAGERVMEVEWSIADIRADGADVMAPTPARQAVVSAFRRSRDAMAIADPEFEPSI